MRDVQQIGDAPDAVLLVLVQLVIGESDAPEATHQLAFLAGVEGLVELAGEKGCTPSQLALAWNISQAGITSAITGPRTKDQMADNLGATEVEITDEDRARLDELAPPLGVTLRYYDAALSIDFKPNLMRW